MYFFIGRPTALRCAAVIDFRRRPANRCWLCTRGQRSFEPPPLGERALTTCRDAEIYRGSLFELRSDSRAFRSNKNRPRTQAQAIHANFLMNLEAPPGFEPGMEVLQTSALPLGDGADSSSCWYRKTRPRLCAASTARRLTGQVQHRSNLLAKRRETPLRIHRDWRVQGDPPYVPVRLRATRFGGTTSATRS